MTKWIGVAILGLIPMIVCFAIDPAAAAHVDVRQRQTSQASDVVTDVGTRRRARPAARYAYRTYYDDRPTYYRPYPYAVPAPFFLGFGFGRRW